jgi:transcriptional regulator with XRE-family HTH domain
LSPDWPLVIRQILAATDCDLASLAKHCGVCKSAVEQWLSGGKRPNFENGWELINAYVSNVSKRVPQRTVEQWTTRRTVGELIGGRTTIRSN